jgi:hypothetical protein
MNLPVFKRDMDDEQIHGNSRQRNGIQEEGSGHEQCRMAGIPIFGIELLGKAKKEYHLCTKYHF